MRALLVSLVGAVVSGCAASVPPAAPRAPASDASDLEALYWQRQEAARQRFTDADVAFMTGMIGHHAQALVMSRLAPTHGASPAVRRLAARILNGQRDEIATMQRWLGDRGQPVPVVTEDGQTLRPPGAANPHAGHTMSGMGDPSDETHAAHVAGGTHARHQADGTHAAHHGTDAEEPAGHGASHGVAGGTAAMDHASMPGMLSAAQLAELDAARGPDFDRLFLRYMIQHHGGAIVMVDELVAQDGAVQDEASFKLAADVRVDQTTEIARMQSMLDALTGDGSP